MIDGNVDVWLDGVQSIPNLIIEGSTCIPGIYSKAFTCVVSIAERCWEVVVDSRRTGVICALLISLKELKIERSYTYFPYLTKELYISIFYMKKYGKGSQTHKKYMTRKIFSHEQHPRKSFKKS